MSAKPPSGKLTTMLRQVSMLVSCMATESSSLRQCSCRLTTPLLVWVIRQIMPCRHQLS